MPEIKDYPTGTPAADDILVIQTALGATESYLTEALLLALGATASYGEFYLSAPGGGSAIAVGTTYVGFTGGTEGLIAGAPYVTSDMAHATADQLIIGSSGGGIYVVLLSTCMSGSNSITITAALHLNGVETRLAFERKLGTTGDVGAAPFVGLIALAAGDYVDMRIKADSAAKSVTPHRVNLTLIRIKGT